MRGIWFKSDNLFICFVLCHYILLLLISLALKSNNELTAFQINSVSGH